MRTASPEELKRAQENGRRAYRRSYLNQSERLLEALKSGPMSVGALIHAVRGSVESVRQRLGRMRRLGQIKRVDDSLPLYHLDCRVELGEEVVYRKTRHECKKAEEPQRKTRSSGSGVIAGPVTIGRGFRWGSSIV